MNISEIESAVITCMEKNVEMAGGKAAKITGATIPMSDLDDFDSLRAIEVLVDLEAVIGKSLSPEKIFSNNSQSIKDIAKAIKASLEEPNVK